MLSDFMEGGSPVMTPFKPTPSEATQESGTRTEQVARSPPAVLVPTGLSDKEIARLRAQTLSSQRSQPSHPRPHHLLTSDVSQSTSTSSPIAIHESDEAASSYDPRRLRSEVESLRREMEQLRTSGLAAGAPPSYTEGDG